VLYLAEWAHYPEQRAKIMKEREVKKQQFDQMNKNELAAAEKKRNDRKKHILLQNKNYDS